MQLAGCYPCPGLVSYVRTFTHNKAAGQLLLEDVLEFAQPQPVTEVFVSQTPIRLVPGGAVFARQGVSLTLRFDPAQFSAALLEEQYPPHEDGPDRTAYLLHLNAAPALRHVCRFTLE